MEIPPGPSLTTSNPPKDPPKDSTSNLLPTVVQEQDNCLTLGHQGVGNTGGIDKDQRVLICSNIDLSLSYQGIYMVMKRFGTVERMKLHLQKRQQTYNCFTVFENSNQAHEACKNLKGHHINGLAVDTKLLRYSKFTPGAFDFIPVEKKKLILNNLQRESPTITWYVVKYREGRENMMMASEYLEQEIGTIPQENIKRYGKSILIEAGDDSQASMLSHFQPSEESNIESITPHKTFNTLKGIVYSRELYQYTEDQILDRCPLYVYAVKKLRNNNAVLLFFSSDFIPDYILVNNVRVKVKRFKPSPNLCRKCYEYGHTAFHCNNQRKCWSCSGSHEYMETCPHPKFCFHCEEDHSPSSKLCPKYSFEQEVIDVANNEHISVGHAKRKIMGANKNTGSTYASTVKKGKKAHVENNNDTHLKHPRND